jgi:tellurite methyltransferase
MTGLLQQFGEIDIYLFDQLLRGRIAPGMRIIDAGCGGGRNLLYLLRQGYDVAGCDRDHTAVEAVRAMASHLAPQLPGGNFRVEPI